MKEVWISLMRGFTWENLTKKKYSQTSFEKEEMVLCFVLKGDFEMTVPI